MIQRDRGTQVETEKDIQKDGENEEETWLEGELRSNRATSRSIIPGCGSRVSNAELFNINTTKIWFRLSCRANIIRIDRRNLLKLTNKHLGKHRPIISKFKLVFTIIQ